MPSAELLLSFAVATAVFAYMPGPAMLYSAAQTLARGRAGGLMAALGIHLGGYVHVAAAALGLSAALRYVPEAYLAVKLAGAAYLVFLGIRMVRAPAGPSIAAPAEAPRSARRAFAESVAVEVLNPKAALFYVAFLPQFVDPAAGLAVGAQLLVLGTVVNLAFSSADLVVVFTAAALMRRLRRAGPVQRVARWIGGSILVGLGLRMAIARD